MTETTRKLSHCQNCDLLVCDDPASDRFGGFTELGMGPYCFSCIDTAQEVEDRNAGF